MTIFNICTNNWCLMGRDGLNPSENRERVEISEKGCHSLVKGFSEGSKELKGVTREIQKSGNEEF